MSWSKLTKREAELMRLLIAERYPIEDAAAIMKISLGTAKIHKANAFRALGASRFLDALYVLYTLEARGGDAT